MIFSVILELLATNAPPKRSHAVGAVVAEADDVRATVTGGVGHEPRVAIDLPAPASAAKPKPTTTYAGAPERPPGCWRETQTPSSANSTMSRRRHHRWCRSRTAGGDRRASHPPRRKPPPPGPAGPAELLSARPRLIWSSLTGCCSLMKISSRWSLTQKTPWRPIDFRRSQSRASSCPSSSGRTSCPRCVRTRSTLPRRDSSRGLGPARRG